MKKIVSVLAILLTFQLAVSAEEFVDVEKRNKEPDIQSIYREVKTEHDYGVVLNSSGKKGDFDSEMVDNPSVFYHNSRWYMTYVGFDGEGYRTGLATSKNLTDWKKLGVILDHSDRKEKSFDSYSVAGYIACTQEWGKPPVPLRFNGKYVMTYLGTSEPGYEKGKVCAGIAFADRIEGPWIKQKEPILVPTMDYEHDKIWKSNLVIQNGAFYLFYNTGTSPEVMSVAISNDLKTFTKYEENPILKTEFNSYDYSYSFNCDPQVARIRDKWVMFFFTDMDGAIVDSFALSDDLLNWKKSYIPLTSTKQPYNKNCAHKPWVFKAEDTVYHFYCAVNQDSRAIAFASSSDKKQIDSRIKRNEMVAVLRTGVLVILPFSLILFGFYWFIDRNRKKKSRKL